MKDGRLNELDSIERDMLALNPITSTWKKLREKRDRLYEELFPSIDNGTLHVEVPTPDDWKCKRKGCTTDFYHEHGTFSSIKKK